MLNSGPLWRNNLLLAGQSSLFFTFHLRIPFSHVTIPLILGDEFFNLNLIQDKFQCCFSPLTRLSGQVWALSSSPAAHRYLCNLEGKEGRRETREERRGKKEGGNWEDWGDGGDQKQEEKKLWDAACFVVRCILFLHSFVYLSQQTNHFFWNWRVQHEKICLVFNIY